MYLKTVPPKVIKKWFNGEEPLSDYGKIKLGEIYILEGNTEEGSRLIKEGWIKAKLSKNDLSFSYLFKTNKSFDNTTVRATLLKEIQLKG